ncbi:hypothetical protein NP233_g10717 [Leucocoprinus birnbaumii]|uniref:Uncharacterized protein n=1 Tax=Leucocoprinus birnbaumii TaxID=56174 RepID=A0AAD5VHV8_9AGAR|nr:hypothetical protein NP233_g10717 [Leucocoprinus birnbaumii]
MEMTATWEDRIAVVSASSPPSLIVVNSNPCIPPKFPPTLSGPLVHDDLRPCDISMLDTPALYHQCLMKSIQCGKSLIMDDMGIRTPSSAARWLKDFPSDTETRLLGKLLQLALSILAEDSAEGSAETKEVEE